MDSPRASPPHRSRCICALSLSLSLALGFLVLFSLPFSRGKSDLLLKWSRAASNHPGFGANIHTPLAAAAAENAAALGALSSLRELLLGRGSRRRAAATSLPPDASPAASAAAAANAATTAAAATEGAAVFARTSRFLTEHATLQAAMLRGEPGSRQRYVGWKVTQHTSEMGLGNRVIGIVSALALALATRRAFVIVDDDIVTTALDAAPPAEGGLDMRFAEALAAAGRAGAAWNERHFVWALGADETCGCLDFTSSDATMLTVETTQYAVPCLLHNPHLRNFFAEAFGPVMAVFRPILQRFFRLKPALQAELDRFDRDVLHAPPLAGVAVGGRRPRRRHVVGLHLRTQHLVRQRHEESVFYRCAEHLGAVARTGAASVARSAAARGAARDYALAPAAGTVRRPTLSGDDEMGDADIESALRLIEAALRGGGGGGGGGAPPSPPPRYRAAATAVAGGMAAAAAAVEPASEVEEDEEVDVYYFLATDSPEVRARAAARFGDRLLTWSEHPDGGASLPRGAGAVIDTWLLSRCDDVILTYPKSTFGFIGAALSQTGLPPHVVVSGSKRANECVRLTSMEPVFHGWFMRWFLSCYERRAWETPHMLNQENAYHCVMAPGKAIRPGGGAEDPYTWDVHRCPAGDAADSYLFLASPFEYEATLETPASEAFYGDLEPLDRGGQGRAKLLERFAPYYERFLARAGPPL